MAVPIIQDFMPGQLLLALTDTFVQPLATDIFCLHTMLEKQNQSSSWYGYVSGPNDSNFNLISDTSSPLSTSLTKWHSTPILTCTSERHLPCCLAWLRQQGMQY